MTPTVPEYLPRSGGTRATAFSVILGAHVLGVIAFLSLGGVAVVLKTAPMLVDLLPEPPRAKPPIPVQTIPLPQLRKPDIRIPDLPRVDIIQMVQVVEQPVTPPPQVKAVPVAEPPVAAPASVEPPRFGMAYLNNPAPTYPPVSRRTREQGKVLLRVLVSPAGLVEQIEIQTSSGFTRLDDAALDAVRRWKFQPARSGNQSVAGWALVPINFELS